MLTSRGWWLLLITLTLLGLGAVMSLRPAAGGRALRGRPCPDRRRAGILLSRYVPASAGARAGAADARGRRGPPPGDQALQPAAAARRPPPPPFRQRQRTPGAARLPPR